METSNFDFMSNNDSLKVMTVDKCNYCDTDFTGAVKKDSFSSASFMFPACCVGRRELQLSAPGSGGSWLLSEPQCVSCHCLSVDLAMLRSVCWPHL